MSISRKPPCPSLHVQAWPTTETDPTKGRISVAAHLRTDYETRHDHQMPPFDQSVATSLTYRTEAAVQETFDCLQSGRTTFVIAQRLVTVVHAERTIALKNGVLDEEGNHSNSCYATVSTPPW